MFWCIFLYFSTSMVGPYFCRRSRHMAILQEKGFLLVKSAYFTENWLCLSNRNIFLGDGKGQTNLKWFFSSHRFFPKTNKHPYLQLNEYETAPYLIQFSQNPQLFCSDVQNNLRFSSGKFGEQHRNQQTISSQVLAELNKIWSFLIFIKLYYCMF